MFSIIIAFMISVWVVTFKKIINYSFFLTNVSRENLRLNYNVY
jgi:hypothetical protein